MMIDSDNNMLPQPPSGSGLVKTNGPRIFCGYEILDTLGKGMSGKVKRARHPHSGEIIALKVIKKETATRRSLAQLQTEIMTMKALQHENIVQLYHVDLDAEYPRKNGLTRRVMTLAIELCTGGELFDFLMHTQAFQEDIARTFFKQMMSALAFCHSQGIYHRDIKPENLLLDEKFQLKIADFGLSAMRNNPDELLQTECGTKSYMAPEILAHRDYEGGKADVWSSGVVLFIMLAGNPPFQHAKPGDWWFDRVTEGNYEKFWKAHVRYCPNFPMLARACVNKMFSPKPEDRPSAEEIMKHPWAAGQVMNPEALFQELSRRKLRVDQAKEAERLQAQREKARQSRMMNGRQAYDPFQRNVHRSVATLSNNKGGEEVTMAPQLDPSKVLGYTNFYSPASASEIVTQLKQVIDTMGGTVKTKENNNFSLKTILTNNDQKCEIKINIYSASNDDSVNLVDITRSQGDHFIFKKIYDNLLEAVPDLLVESNLEDEVEKTEESNKQENDETEDKEADLEEDMDMI